MRHQHWWQLHGWRLGSSPRALDLHHSSNQTYQLSFLNFVHLVVFLFKDVNKTAGPFQLVCVLTMYRRGCNWPQKRANIWPVVSRHNNFNVTFEAVPNHPTYWVIKWKHYQIIVTRKLKCFHVAKFLTTICQGFTNYQDYFKNLVNFSGFTLPVSRVPDWLLMVPHVSKSGASQHLPSSSHEHYSVVTRSWLPVLTFGWRVTLDIQHFQILSNLPGHISWNNIAVIALICMFYP